MSTRINTAGERVRLGARPKLRKEIKLILPRAGEAIVLHHPTIINGKLWLATWGCILFAVLYLALSFSCLLRSPAVSHPSAPLSHSLTCVFTQAVALAKFLEPAQIDVSATFNAPACISACLKLLQIKCPPPRLCGATARNFLNSCSSASVFGLGLQFFGSTAVAVCVH